MQEKLLESDGAKSELNKISDSELVCALTKAVQAERVATLELLDYLSEMDKRRLFLKAGYSSLYDYCKFRLKLSDGATYRRIAAMRCMKENPQLRPAFLKAEVTLCSLATAAKLIQDKKIEVQNIMGKSKREVEALIANTVPVCKPKESVKAMMVNLEVSRPVQVNKPAEEVAESENSSLLAQRRLEQRYSLKFSVTKEVYDKYERVRNKLSHSLGADFSIEAVFEKLLDKECKSST